MTSPAIETTTVDGQYVSFAGLSLHSILSAELFLESAGDRPGMAVPDLCQRKWAALANTLAALPDSTEFMLVLGGCHGCGTKGNSVVFLAAGRGASLAESEAHCLRSFKNLRTLFSSHLDYAEFAAVTSKETLSRTVAQLGEGHVFEVRRRLELLRVGHGVIERSPIGFGRPPEEPRADGKTLESAERSLSMPHLFPCEPGDDSWLKLLELLSESREGAAAVVMHFRTFRRASRARVDDIAASMAVAEQVVASRVDANVKTLFSLQADALRHEALRRLGILEGRLIAARVFITSSQPVPEALSAAVVGCFDPVPVKTPENSVRAIFRGGANILPCPQGAPLSPLDDPTVDILFSPEEATSILRTPMPVECELPGVSLNRSRTSAISGRSGDDVPLGSNIHRGKGSRVALDDAMRFRHTYVVGQTGSGKSTFLLHQILHDIKLGRGVAVLDPHGTLIDQILLHYPKERGEDLAIVDVTDVERPVGFNILRITEPDALQYRLARDIVIDDLHSYLERSYDINMMGPVFETHFRGMMSLLLGLEPQDDEMTPNLLIFRSLYTNRELREHLMRRVKNRDLMVDDFIREVTSSTGEMSLHNTATYVTSKFNRFVSDMTLRNITCQNSMLDMDDVVDNGRVLLFYLGRGRFGDQAAGLLASQVVSRLRHAVMKRGGAPDARPFYLYADEFQLFADKRFAELLAEARKFKLSLTLAHQYLEQLPPAVLQGVLGNVGTTVTFRVGAPDAERLEALYKPTFGARDLTSLPNYRAYVRSFGALGHAPFSLDTDAPPAGGDEMKADALKQLARLKHGRDRLTVEDEIRRTYESYSQASLLI